MPSLQSDTPTLNVSLFDSAPQYREKAALWYIFSDFSLFAPLAGGRVWKWFAINIPMDLGTGGAFTRDIDIVARLHDFPRSQDWFYRTWEVKVSLVCKDGTPRSVKVGKLNRTLSQLKGYRKFGSPDVSLLDLYICEEGYIRLNSFPPPTLAEGISNKIAELRRHGFGYQLLPFEPDSRLPSGVWTYKLPTAWSPLRNTFDLVPPKTAGPEQPFSRFAYRLNEFFENANDRSGKSFNQIVYCRQCRGLQLLRAKYDHLCPACKADLIPQF